MAKTGLPIEGDLTVSICLLFILQSISSMKVMQFQGTGKKAMPISLPPVEHHDLTPSPDVPFAIMKRKLMATNDISEAKKIAAQMKAYLEVRKEKKNCLSGQINFYPKQWQKENPRKLTKLLFRLVTSSCDGLFFI